MKQKNDKSKPGKKMDKDVATAYEQLQTDVSYQKLDLSMVKLIYIIDTYDV